MLKKSELVFIFLFAISFQALGKTVVIDPGHGGNDQGASYFNVKESDLVLRIAFKVKQRLQDQNQLKAIILTREKNNYVSLEQRVQIPLKAESRPDLFVSLHANSSNLKSIRGMEIYFRTDSKKTENENAVDQILADLKNTGLTRQSLKASQLLQKKWTMGPSVIRRSAFYVLEHSEVPSILIEMGFLSNPQESLLLQSDSYQNQIAENIAQSILDYLDSPPQSIQK